MSNQIIDEAENTKNALKDTRELRQHIGEMRDMLNQMLAAKRQGNTNNIQQQIGEKNIITSFLKMRTMRKKHRHIQISIEEERNKIRTEKEKIEKTSVYLSGLEYLQSTIQNSIQKCQSIHMDKLPTVNNEQIQSHLKRKAVQDFIGEDFIDLRGELEDELQKRIKKNDDRTLISQQLVDQRQKYDTVINQYTQQLPPILLSLTENLKGFNQIFVPATNIPLSLNPNQHNLASQLPPPLYSVYSKLSLLFETTPSLSSSVEIISQNPNSSNNKRQNELHHLELCVTIKQYLPQVINTIDSFFSAYKLSVQKQTIASVYPIKFIIRQLLKQIIIYIDNLNTLVIQLDSKHMKGKELFSGLFQNDFGSPLILHTNDEYDKNLNQQYEFYYWLQILGGINNRGECTIKVDADMIIRKINERFISKRAVKCVIDALTSNNFVVNPLLKSQKEIVNSSELLKYKFEQKQKLSNANDLANSNLYKQLKPVWLKERQEQQYDLIEEESNNMKLVDQITQQQNEYQTKQSQNQSNQQYVIPSKEVLKMINLENESNETEIHIFNITKGDQFTAQVMFIMPLSTLIQEPCLKVLSAQLKLSQPIKTPLSSLFSKELIISNAENKSDNSQSINTQNLNSLIINQIEREMKDISQLMPETNSAVNGSKNMQFSFIYQLNRLITLFEISINHYQKYVNLGSKCFATTMYDILDI